MIAHALLALGMSFGQATVAIPTHPVMPVSATVTNAVASKQTRCPVITAGNELQPLRQTCEFALASKKSLPDFICQEKIQRFRSLPSQNRNTLGWESTGILTAEVRFGHEGESYSNITVDGHPVSIPEDAHTSEEVSNALAKKTKGTWVVGEFGSDLYFVFDLRNHAAFKRTGTQSADSVIFNYSVNAADSTFRWTSGDKTAHPGIIGSMWIDPITSNLQRITLRSAGINEGFPMDLLSIDTAYGMVTIQDAGSFLLPEVSNTVQCFNDSTRCFRTQVEFHGCKKFGSESHMILSDSEPPLN